MTIAINAYYLGKPEQGFGRFTENFLDSIVKFDNPENYTLLIPEKINPNLKKKYSRFNFEVSRKKPSDQYDWSFNIAEFIDTSKFSLLYIPYNTSPERPPECPFIVTIHDTIPLVPFSIEALKHPGLFSLFNITEYRRMKRELKAALNASYITTVSQFSKTTILKNINYPESRIEVIYNSIGKNFKPANTNQIQKVKKKYGINQDYLFYLGGIRNRKNVEGLLKTYAFLPLELKKKYKLVISGSIKNSKKYSSIIKKHKIAEFVIETGKLPEEDIPALYSGAKLFLFLSLYEGFGLPPVEAAACGTPSLVSNTSSIPEIAKGFGKMVNPYNPGKASKELKYLLENKNEYDKLKKMCK
ncbi:MAG: glycosyltransferase family 4 protein, partial [Spirochaetes bacterium]|nr:glycosyltransferase family 4 protein [Spirochaetota bacterium]